MEAVVVRHVLSPALLPGATGRADSFAEARAALLATLAAQLSWARDDREPRGLGAAAGAAGGDPADPVADQRAGAPVVVVAAARWSRLAVDARPDLAALGLARPALPVGSRGGGADAAPALDVTASVAVTMIRLAGWAGPVETVEISAPTGDVDGSDLDAVLATVREGRRLVVVALGSAETELPAGARPDLAAGHRRVRRLADELVPADSYRGETVEH